MTRQTRTLAALGAALAVCGGAYAGLRLWNQAQGEAAADYVIQLSQPTALSFTSGGDTLAFSRTDDGWTWAGDAAFPADQDTLDRLADSAAALEALRVISDPEGLSSYGLDQPSLTLSVSDESGETAELLIGSAGDGFYYAKRTDGDAVYTISTDLPEELSGLELLDLAAIPDFPDLGADNLDQTTLTRGSETLILTRTEAASGDESGSDSSGDSSGDSSQASEDADTWDVNGTEVPADNSALTSFIAQLSALAFDRCHDYQGADETLAACGLDRPSATLEVRYDGDSSLTLELGDLDGSGEAYYARLSGDPAVYLISADGVSTLFSLTREQLTQQEQAAGG